jgi:hypothetical protein
MTNPTITLPAEEISAGDLLDSGLDKLRTCWIALQPENKGWLDDAALHSIAVTINSAIRDLEPVRRQLQCGKDKS